MIKAKIFGQSRPAAGAAELLFSVPDGCNAQGSIKAQNQSGSVDDLISIALVPGGGTPTGVNWLPIYWTLNPGQVLERDFRIDAGGEVYVRSENGTSVFHADGLEVS